MLGYVYFLVHRHKGIVGTLFASPAPGAQRVAEEILIRAIADLKAIDALGRIEAQIIPFHHLNLTAVFTRHGFRYFPRYFLELDLAAHPQQPPPPPGPHRIVAWTAGRLEGASRVILRSYADQTDAQICEDYTSAAGCAGYLRSLVENPGCGVFLPEASFTALEADDTPCGVVLASRISPSGAMIPQISVLPEHQGAGLGSALVHHSLERFKELGFRSVSLTVSKKNRRAFEWYQRLGFRVRKEFGAYVWQR
jgi:ribosomal protein S18 acetylase RimI-like enzyme